MTHNALCFHKTREHVSVIRARGGCQAASPGVSAVRRPSLREGGRRASRAWVPPSLHQPLDGSSREIREETLSVCLFPIRQPQGIACCCLSFSNENNRLIYLAFTHEKELCPDTHSLANNQEMDCSVRTLRYLLKRTGKYLSCPSAKFGRFLRSIAHLHEEACHYFAASEIWPVFKVHSFFE